MIEEVTKLRCDGVRDKAAGMRIISRIAGMCKTVEMTGKDWRVVR